MAHTRVASTNALSARLGRAGWPPARAPATDGSGAGQVRAVPMQMIEERGAAGLDRAHVLCTVALEAGRMGKRELQARDDIGRRHQMHELRGSEQAARVASRRDAATLREVLPHFILPRRR